MKNSAIIKTTVMMPAICTDRFGCLKEFEKMSSDHSVIGNVSRADLPTLRGALSRAGKIRASEAIEMSPHEHRKSQINVEASNEYHRHSSDCGYSLTAPHAAQSNEWQKPDGSSNEKYGEKQQRRSCTLQFSRSHTGNHKWRA